MALAPTPASAMKFLAFLALLASPSPLLAADASKTAADPLAGAFFPPELVLLARDRIALTAQQEQTLRDRVENSRRRSRETASDVGTRNRRTCGTGQAGSRG